MIQTTLPSRRRAGKENYYKATVRNTDLYRFYTDKYGTPTKGGCALPTFRRVINDFNFYLAECLLKGDKIELPHRLGSLSVIKKKQRIRLRFDNTIDTKFLIIDWPKTWEYWKKNSEAALKKKLLYYMNDHTDGFRYKFFWDKYGINSEHIRFFSFKPSRLLSRRLPEVLADEDTIKNYAELC